MASRVIVLYGLIYFFHSCSIKPVYDKLKTNVNDIFFIEAQCTFDDTDDKGAVTGTLLCGNIALKYNYGKDIYSGPLTQEEEFRNAFRGNSHAKFFEKIYIDSKLYMFFMDSVHVEKIILIQQPDKSLLFPCAACNKVARLFFRKKIYFYPFYSDFEEDKNYTITTDTIDGFYRKIYLSNSDTLPSGLQLSPILKSKDRKTLCLSSESQTGDTELMNLFKSVQIIK